MQENFAELLDDVKEPPDAINLCELTHRLTMVVLSSGLDGTMSAIHMRNRQLSPMGIARHLAREVEKLLTTPVTK